MQRRTSFNLNQTKKQRRKKQKRKKHDEAANKYPNFLTRKQHQFPKNVVLCCRKKVNKAKEKIGESSWETHTHTSKKRKQKQKQKKNETDIGAKRKKNDGKRKK